MKLIRDWLAGRPRRHLHFTPTGVSRIDQVERFLALITDDILAAIQPLMHQNR